MSQDKKNREILKEYFETGDRPTQTQFEQLIDSGINQVEDQIHVDSSNQNNPKVGIGTASPSEKLDVHGNVRVNDSALYLREHNEYDGLAYHENFKDLNSGNNDVTIQGPVLFGDNGGALAVNESGTKKIALKWSNHGYVGIGLDYRTHTRPLSPLHVHKINGDNIGQTGLQLTGQSNNAGDVLASDGDGVVKWMPATEVTKGLWKAASNPNDIENGNSGNVGIGTDKPTEKLDVKGSINVQGNIHGSADNNIFSIGQGAIKRPFITFYGLNSEGPWVNPGQLRFNAGDGVSNPNTKDSNGNSTNTKTGGFTFIQHGDEWKTLMEIEKDGNVGIGTKYPTSKLHVNGDIRLVDTSIYLRGGSDQNHGLRYVGSELFDNEFFSKTEKMNNKHSINGPYLFGYQGGALGSTGNIGGENMALQWFEDKSVDFKGKLTVKGLPPFVFENYNVGKNTPNDSRIINEGDNKAKLLKYKYDEYQACVIGWQFSNIQQFNESNGTMKAMVSRHSTDSNYWQININAPHTDNDHWVHILFIRKELF